jgi:hypothetical protein
MNKIFVFIQTRWDHGDVVAAALGDDGDFLASHLSSSESFARHDMGVEHSNWKHDKYAAHFPDGFEIEWVPSTEVKARTHAGLEAAYALHVAKNSAE